MVPPAYQEGGTRRAVLLPAQEALDQARQKAASLVRRFPDAMILGSDTLIGLDGDYLAVVGLPLKAVAEGLAKLGCPAVVDVDRLYREQGFLNWQAFNS